VKTIPNWCENDLTIKGPKEELIKFANFVSNGTNYFDFNKILPLPAELAGGKSPSDFSKKKNAELVKKYGFDNWYDWQIMNWGTKWNAHLEEKFTIEDREMFAYFATAWSPPEPLIIEASRQFPLLTFKLKFWEGGGGFRGMLICKAGEILKQVTYNYKGDKGG